MKIIRSQNHQLGSYEINKVSFSCFDDKRYMYIFTKKASPFAKRDVLLFNQSNAQLSC